VFVKELCRESKTRSYFLDCSRIVEGFLSNGNLQQSLADALVLETPKIPSKQGGKLTKITRGES
jgi:hypothetical protein